MSLLDWFRKGLGYVLLTMGVSRPAPRPRPAPPDGETAHPAPKQDSTSPPQ
jgi:hypothetical protein